LANIPENVVKKIMPQDRNWAYGKYCLDFVVGLHFEPTFEFKNLEFIQCGDEKLYLPTKKHILGEEIPMYDTSAWQFTEAADLKIAHSKNRYEVMANIVTILCKPKGEEYDQDSALERAEKLKDMPFSDAYEVFFCSKEFLISQIRQDQISLENLLAESLHPKSFKRGIQRFFRLPKVFQTLKLQRK